MVANRQKTAWILNNRIFVRARLLSKPRYMHLKIEMNMQNCFLSLKTNLSHHVFSSVALWCSSWAVRRQRCPHLPRGGAVILHQQSRSPGGNADPWLCSLFLFFFKSFYLIVLFFHNKQKDRRTFFCLNMTYFNDLCVQASVFKGCNEI